MLGPNTTSHDLGSNRDIRGGGKHIMANTTLPVTLLGSAYLAHKDA